MKRLLPLMFFCYSFILVAQVTNEGEPVSWSFSKKSSLVAKTLPQIDLKKVKAEDEINDKKLDIPYRVGVIHKVDNGLDNSGEWTELENGDRVWKMLFTSKDAVFLSVVFEKFYLPKGGKVYLFNDDRTDLLGAYTNTSNNENGVLSTWFVNGEKLWVEYYEPKKVKGQGVLNMSSIIHGYRMGHNYQKGYLNEFEKSLNSSADCNHDVVCPVGGDFEMQKNLLKKSVGFLYMPDLVSQTASICSGALVNNTAEDKTPYFLTANHCFGTALPENYTVRFNWISPNPVCAAINSSSDSPDNFTISGTTLRAKNAASDVMLLEINNPIPASWDVTYAGWDRTDTDPEFNISIHHPAGDIMKISRDDDGATKTTSSGAEVWLIDEGSLGGWEIGVTEGGSSGGPLFDQNGRVIGQLYGGNAACNGLTDNNQFDVFGRFATSWDTGTTNGTQLKHWLAPNTVGTNPFTIESFPRLEVFALDGSVSASIPTIVCGNKSVTPTIIVRNAGTTTLTSLTIEWDIDGGTATTFNWTGSLAQNETENIALSPISVSTGDHIFNVTSASPNGTADENLTNDTSAKSFSIANEYTTTKVHLELTTDDWAEETSWTFKDSNDNLIDSWSYKDVDDNTTFNYSFDVTTDECYTFQISDTEGDGICCDFGLGSYSLKTDDNTVIISGGAFGASETTEMSIVATLAVNDAYLEKNISIFPNPTSGFVQIKIREWVSDLKYEVYNVLGQTLKHNVLQNNEILDLMDLPSDIYFIKITEIETNKSMVRKIVLNK